MTLEEKTLKLRKLIGKTFIGISIATASFVSGATGINHYLNNNHIIGDNEKLVMTKSDGMYEKSTLYIFENGNSALKKENLITKATTFYQDTDGDGKVDRILEYAGPLGTSRIIINSELHPKEFMKGDALLKTQKERFEKTYGPYMDSYSSSD